MSAIFLFPVYLTYWPRKYAACCVPHDESFHQVWSWYDHPLSSYCVPAVDTLRDPVTLTFDLLTLVSGHTFRLTWSTPPASLSYGYPFLSYEFWHLLWITLTVCSQPLRMGRITWPVRRGNFSHIVWHIWNHRPRFPIYYFYGATISKMTFKGLSLSNLPMSKRFWAKISKYLRNRAPKCWFWEKTGCKC